MRFIDLRRQIIITDNYPMFAFFDTVTDTFVTINGNQTWSSQQEIIKDIKSENPHNPTERFERLLESWVPLEAPADE